MSSKAKAKTLVSTQPGVTIHLHSRPPVQTQDMTTDTLHAVLRSSEAGQWDDYLALVRDVTAGDITVLNAWGQRKTRLLGKAWSLTPEDKKSPAAARNAEMMTAQLKGVKGFLDARIHLLDSTLFPVSVVEKVYARSAGGWMLKQLVPVPHDLLSYRAGRLQIKVTTPEGVPTGECVDIDPARYIVHRGHLLRSLPDCWGGPARALLFYWFLAAAGRSWWSRGLERDSAPFLLGKYDPANPDDRYSMESAFADAVQRFGLVVSRDTDVQVFKDLASGSAAAHEAYQNHMLGMMQRLIAGQTLTSTAQAQGLGSSQATVQNDVLTDTVAFDDMLLAETLQEQLFIPVQQLRGMSGPPPIISHGVISENLLARATVVKELAAAGIFLAPDAAGPLSESLGLPVVIPARTQGLAVLSAPAPARGDVAELAQAFRGSLAPVRKIILDSTSPEECEASLRAFFPDWRPQRLAALTAEALSLFAARGAAAAPA